MPATVKIPVVPVRYPNSMPEVVSKVPPVAVQVPLPALAEPTLIQEFPTPWLVTRPPEWLNQPWSVALLLPMLN